MVDISGEFEQKCVAVAAYKSQFEDPQNAKRIFQPGVNIYDFMQIRARQLGQLVGVEYAEAFTVREHVLIDDPQKMPVRSIWTDKLLTSQNITTQIKMDSMGFDRIIITYNTLITYSNQSTFASHPV